MKLVHNWRSILKNAWSIRLLLLAGVFSMIEVALPFVQQRYMVPPGIFAALTIISTGGAIVARLVAQKSIEGSK